LYSTKQNKDVESFGFCAGFNQISLGYTAYITSEFKCFLIKLDICGDIHDEFKDFCRLISVFEWTFYKTYPVFEDQNEEGVVPCTCASKINKLSQCS